MFKYFGRSKHGHACIEVTYNMLEVSTTINANLLKYAFPFLSCLVKCLKMKCLYTWTQTQFIRRRRYLQSVPISPIGVTLDAFGLGVTLDAFSLVTACNYIEFYNY